MLIEYTKEVESYVSSVIVKNNQYLCQRCLNSDKDEFFKDQLGVYCRQCLTFGKSSTYNQINRKQITSEYHDKYCLNHVIYLSEMQKIASFRCVEAFKKKKDLLIFAVCGAGKTEIVYEVILKALNEEKIVCFATPRKDVVLELVPRFKRDFFQVNIVALYGNSPDKGKLGNLYVSTTHQLINYYHYFDLIILDEVDAFPYYNNKMLEGFIKKAKKETAPIILLTATPTKKFKYLMKTKQLDYFIIPSRFHRYPIPVPKVKLTHQTINKLRHNKCPPTILKWLIKKKDSDKRVFIFVPNIACGKLLESCLKKELNCQFVFSEMKERKEIINRFRENKLQFIITTTILERGVTVANVDVCIINADDDIFDERSIVQIVGRAGRDKRYPEADVIIFADYYTVGIKASIKHIESMNQIARKKNLLK